MDSEQPPSSETGGTELAAATAGQAASAVATQASSAAATAPAEVAIALSTGFNSPPPLLGGGSVAAGTAAAARAGAGTASALGKRKAGGPAEGDPAAGTYQYSAAQIEALKAGGKRSSQVFLPGGDAISWSAVIVGSRVSGSSSAI